MTELSKRTIQVGITLGAIVSLVGCADQSDGLTGDEAYAIISSNGLIGANGLISVNGLGSGNGLIGANGLNSYNGLGSANGLGSSNGLSSGNGLMTTDAGRKTVAYIVKCALAANDTLVKQDQNNVSYTFAGGIGLCPAWKNGSIFDNGDCQRDISACIMAHVNTAGVHVPIWLDSSASAIGWGVDPVNYPSQEGTFFGNILATGPMANIGMPSVNAPAAYFCDGDSFQAGNQGVVAGRLGKGQNNAPYTNPFGDGSLCRYSGGSDGQWSNGKNNPDGSIKPADGYKAISASGFTFNHAITVWRNPTYVPTFDAGYVYRLSPMQVTGKSLDVCNAAQTNGTCVQQWGSWDGDAQKFNILPSGSNWKITMKANNAKCIGPVANGTTNGTKIEVQDCNGSTNQAWSVTADAASGAFTFKNVASYRCLDVTANSTSDGGLMELYYCNGGGNQKFKVQAY